MNKNQLLELYYSSHLTPNELRLADPALFAHLAGSAYDELRAALNVRLAAAPAALREQLDQADLAKVVEGDLEIERALHDAVDIGRLPPAELIDALRRLDELARPQAIRQPLAVDAPLCDQPLVQDDLDMARLYLAGDVAGVPEARIEKLLDNGVRFSSLIDSTLASLVDTGDLTDGEARKLGLAASLTRLVEGDMQLAAVLQQGRFSRLGRRKIREVRDLAIFTAEDWTPILRKAGAQPAHGETLPEMAARLSRKAAACYPGEALLARLVKVDLARLPVGLAALQPLVARNPAIFGRRAWDDLDSSQLDQAEIAAAQPAFIALKRLVNAYPGLDLGSVLDDPNLTPAEKANRIAARVDLLSRFQVRNAGVELLRLDYAPGSPGLARLDFTGLSLDEQRMVVSTLKAYQRAFTITGDVDCARTLIETGYHSSAGIMRAGLDTFTGDTGLDPALAGRFFDTAANKVGWLANTLGATLDIYWGGFDKLAVGNTAGEIQEYLKKLDGFADLFGSQAFCNCKHCESIYSPAAYFVDLMSFVEEYVTRKHFSGTLKDHLLNLEVRRPDLWTLELTCQNTDEKVPSLDIINPILENYIASQAGYHGPLTDRAAVEQAAYEQSLAVAVNSFRQPFILPLEKLQVYLSHFERTRAGIARVLGAPSAAVVAAALGVSIREYELITQPDASLVFLNGLYGRQFILQPGTDRLVAFDAQELLKPLGLSRDELGKLVATWTVTAGAAQPPNIVMEKSGPASVQNDIEKIYNLTLVALDRMHRLTRLQRRLPWSPDEIDLVLRLLGDPDMGSGAVEGLVMIRALQEQIQVSVEEACALFTDLPLAATPGVTVLFNRLFNLPAFVLLDGEFPKPALLFSHPALVAGGAAPAANALHRLQSGLRLDDPSLALLITRLLGPLQADRAAVPAGDAAFNLTAHNLSLLYRHALLAQRLKLSISDLFRMIGYAGIPGGYVANRDSLAALLEFHAWRQGASFSFDGLAVITGGTPATPTNYPDPKAVAVGLIEDVKTQRLLAFADTTLAFLPKMTEEDSRKIIQAIQASLDAVANEDAYWLKADFNPAAPLAIPGGLPAAEPEVRAALLKHHAGQIIPNGLAGKLGVTVEKVKALVAMTGADLADPVLARALRGDDPPDALVELVRKLLPLHILFHHTVFDAAALAFIAGRPDIFDIADFNHIGVKAVRKLSVYVKFADTGPQAKYSADQPALQPDDVQHVLRDFQPGHGFDVADIGELARVLGCETGLAATLRANASLPATATEALERLGEAADLAGYLGVGGETLKLVISDGYQDLARAADALLGAFRAKYPDEKTWQEQIEPYENKIRSCKRDALVEYLLHSLPAPFKSLDSLFHYFLVDPGLEGCARTTRVVSAISSVQLYVQRCLMNLEQDELPKNNPRHVQVVLPTEAANEWDWRKNYRLWEANRKVFLYPENYIEPELRTDKTPLFKELESTLLQKEINEQNVLDAYSIYLRGFEEVARLKIAGAYHDKNPDERTDRLHLFGVTPGDPPVYYYRPVDNAFYGETESDRGIVWNHWRKIDVQIPVRKVAPIVYQGRLYVFWVAIATSPKNSQVKGGSSEFIGYKHKLALKFTTLKPDGTWSAPQEISLLDYWPFLNGEGVMDDPLMDDYEQADLDLARKEWDQVNQDLHSNDAAVQAQAQAKYKKSQAKYKMADLKTLVPHYEPNQDLLLNPHSEPKDGYTLTGFQWDQIYPGHELGSLILSWAGFLCNGMLDTYEKTIKSREGQQPQVTVSGGAAVVGGAGAGGGQYIPPWPAQVLFAYTPKGKENGPRTLCYRPFAMPVDKQFGELTPYAYFSLYLERRRLVEYQQTHRDWTGSPDNINWSSLTPIATLKPADQLALINGWLESCLVDVGGDLFLLKPDPRYPRFFAPYVMLRYGTTLSTEIEKTLSTRGVDALLDTATQQALGEAKIPVHIEQRYFTDLINTNACKIGKLDFTGPYGVYYREIFFHIPFLIANYLNSQGKFAAAQRWYHYIFNPTAIEVTDPPRDRNWRYLEFRKLDLPRLREILTNKQQIEIYKKDPWSPHAIANLRLSAYQKCIVMKYIDNLLDWGDSLFAQFTTESVNEAVLLYVLAADILGERPAELGDCGEGAVSPKTYRTIGPLVSQDLPFLVELETLTADVTANAEAYRYRFVADPYIFVDGAASAPGNGSGLFEGYRWKETYTGSWSQKHEVTFEREPLPRALAEIRDRAVPLALPSLPVLADTPIRVIGQPRQFKGMERACDFGWSFVRQLRPVFCIPPNTDLQEYWDRVEDRLNKIRNCMDISGVRRDLAPYAPEIDPRLLVRAKAEGLSIEDVLNAISGNLPPYRFTYLIEKARQYAGTLQGFGSALLTALEKRDVEELNRLRVVHQQNLLKLTSQVRQWEIDSAGETVASLEKQQEAIQYRKDYYQGLLDNDLTGWERTQQVARHMATSLQSLPFALDMLSAVLYLIPKAGSPFAITFGGKEQGDSQKGWARVMKDTIAAAEALAASAGLEAGFQRREQGWEYQAQLADYELKQIAKQIKAAEIRKEIALRSLELHEKTIEQTEEIYDYFGSKFSNLGLYRWLSSTLMSLYRDAYNCAFAAARLAEQAFRFERGDDVTPLLKANFWEASHAGLLAGERLLVDLNNLERRFFETNYRCLEIDQSFSLTQINPAALIRLREEGTCEFGVPEFFFDLYYPGQYRRRIKSARLTIPCVTGPYTNVSATLELTGSKLRSKPKLDQAGITYLIDVPLRRSVSIATSTAQNDAGVFELNFRDDRYMPFEGAGAVSSWTLSLPKYFRPFDYQTITDVILHISYTAEEDEGLRAEVEKENAVLAGSLLGYLKNNPSYRLFSLRSDFSNAFHRLLHSPVNNPVKIEITDKYFPIFIQGWSIQPSSTKLVLVTPKDQTTNNFTIAIDLQNQAQFGTNVPLGGLPTKDLGNLLAASLLGEHTLEIKAAGDLAPANLKPGDVSALDAEKLLDILLYIEYKIQ